MASSFLKTFSFILYGVVTFLLLCAVLVLIFKDDKSSCPNTSPISRQDLSSLLNETESLASSSSSSATTAAGTASTAGATDAGGKEEPEYNFVGEYELYSSENFDEFLSELGIGYFTRLAATRASSKYVITKDGDYYVLKTISTFGENSIRFKNGVPFKEDRLDGETVDSVMTIKGNKWIQKQSGSKEVRIIREFLPTEVKVTSVINNVVSVRKYKKI